MAVSTNECSPVISSKFVVDENNSEEKWSTSKIENGYQESENVHGQSNYRHKEEFNKIHENVYVVPTSDSSLHQALPPESGKGKYDITITVSKLEREEESIFKFRSISRKNKLLLIICLFAYFLNGVAYSLLAPFFPEVAAKKGMSLIMNGFVFGVFMLVSFLTMPIFGSYLTTLGPKFVFLSGMFVSGVSTVLQGTVDMCPSGTAFTVITLLCRIIGALGSSAYLTALMATAVNQFPKDVTTVFATLETACGVGLMVGPSIGGLLFDFAGFGLPFYATGVTILLCAPLVYFLVPNSNISERKKTSRWRLLKSPHVVIGMAGNVISGIGISYLDPTLANHLKPFDLSPSVIGLFFVIAPCLYALLSPLWGYVTDHLGVYRQLMTAGQFIFGLSFFLIGPSSWLPFLPFEIWTIVLGLVIAGASMGSSLVPTMKCIVVGSIDVGFSEDIDTYAVVSGLVLSMFFLGAFLGPMASGFLVNAFGSADSFTAIGILNISMGVVELVVFSADYLLESRRLQKQNNAYCSSDKSQSGDVNEFSPLLGLSNDNMRNKHE